MDRRIKGLLLLFNKDFLYVIPTGSLGLYSFLPHLPLSSFKLFNVKRDILHSSFLKRKMKLGSDDMTQELFMSCEILN